jgi:quinol monooxygenase YgiN
MSTLAIADMFGTTSSRDELAALLARAERDVTEQPGCLRYSFATDIGDPNHFILISEWQDQAALDAHYASPQFAEFQYSLYELLARPSEMTVYSVRGSARPLASGPMDPRDAD